MLKTIRRTVQILFLILIVALPVAGNYGALLSGKGQRDFYDVARDDSGTILAGLYHLIHRIVDPPFNPQETVPKIDQFKGALYSITILGFNITDHLSALIATVTSGVVYTPLLLALIIPLVFNILLGRAFCGWICPMGLILEGVAYIRWALNRFFNLLLPDIRLNSVYRYYLLGGGFLSALFGVPVLIFLLPYGLVSREIYNYIFYMAFGFGGVIIVGIILFDLVSDRGWCRYLCPAGAFFSLLSPLRIVRIRRDKKGCPDDCTVCTENCTMGLEPHRDRIGMGCDNCGNCITSCPAGTIKYRIGVGRA